MVLQGNKGRLVLSRVSCLSREQYVSKVMLYEQMGVGYKIEYGKVKLVA